MFIFFIPTASSQKRLREVGTRIPVDDRATSAEMAGQLPALVLERPKRSANIPGHRLQALGYDILPTKLSPKSLATRGYQVASQGQRRFVEVKKLAAMPDQMKTQAVSYANNHVA